MPRTAAEYLIAWRTPVQVTADCLAWALALWVVNGLRYDFRGEFLFSTGLATAVLVVVLLQLIVGMACHLYRGRYRFGSFDEVAGVLVSVATAAAGLTALNLAGLGAQMVPRSVPPVSGIVAFTFIAGIRYAWRLFLDRRRRPTEHGAEPVLVFGAGEGGDQAIAAMLRDPNGRYFPVALIDDDPRKSRLRVRGVRVGGDRSQLGAVAALSGARTVLLAVPSASAELVREMDGLARAEGLSLKVLPAVGELLDGRIELEDIRDIDLPDLLGRRQTELDVDSIAGYLTGRRVLVTGAGGSIGSELCVQIAQYRAGRAHDA